MSEWVEKLSIRAAASWVSWAVPSDLGSPIERAFFLGLLIASRERAMEIWVPRWDPSWPIADFCEGEAKLISPAVPGVEVLVCAQCKVGPYRADFVLGYRLLPFPDVWCWLAVECDGHDYHERTKEQAAHDRERDRMFQLAGLPVFRFTGSQLYKDAVGCATEALEYLERIEQNAWAHQNHKA